MFQNMNEYSEVKFYLYTMRFLGLGTEKREEAVLDELKREIEDGNLEYCGLYYDMLLYRNSLQRIELIKKISEVTDYDSRYMKEHSYIADKSYINVEKTLTNINDCQWEILSKQIEDNKCEKVIVTLGREKILLHTAYSVDTGFVSPYMSTNNKLNYADYTNAKVLFFKGELNIWLILPLLEKIVQEGTNLVIFAQHFEDEMLKMLNVNISHGVCHVCAIEIDFEQKNNKIYNLMEVLRTSVITDERKLKEIRPQELITIPRVIICCNVTYMLFDGRLILNPNDMVNLMEIFVSHEKTLKKYENYLKSRERVIHNNIDSFINYIANKIDNCETIVVEKGVRIKTYFEEVAALYLDVGLLSQDFINCVEQKCVNWNSPSLLLVAEDIDHINNILPILELSIQEKRPLIIIGTYFSQEVINILITNVKKGILRCGCIKINTNTYLEKISESLELQKYTQADIKNIKTMDELNYAEQVYAWKNKCYIVPRRNSDNILSLKNGIEVRKLFRINAGGISLSEQNKMYDDLVALVNKMQQQKNSI